LAARFVGRDAHRTRYRKESAATSLRNKFSQLHLAHEAELQEGASMNARWSAAQSGMESRFLHPAKQVHMFFG
jgi:hypothetical protein